MLTKLGATAIDSKYSRPELLPLRVPDQDDPTWIMIGGTALDVGAGALVAALILGWFGLRMEGGRRYEARAQQMRWASW